MTLAAQGAGFGTAFFRWWQGVDSSRDAVARHFHGFTAATEPGGPTGSPNVQGDLVAAAR